jgi:hypothetical protein
LVPALPLLLATVAAAFTASATSVASTTLDTAAPGTNVSISFRNDVMAVLSKAGCNAGACHGNASGKGGFKLSLRGESPDLDFAALTRDEHGRRINLLQPERSLLLEKPMVALAHEGGRRFRASSELYATLRHWIAAGATNDLGTAPRLTKLEVSPTDVVLVEPSSTVGVRAVATFSDGSRRDVTRLAVYETSNPGAQVSAAGEAKRATFGETTIVVRYLDHQAPVRVAFVPARPEFRWRPAQARNYIDDQILAKLQRLRLNPSPLCDDATFLRRAYLDLLGLIPTDAEARALVAEPGKQKRARLVDRLLERPEFADHWALKWADLLRVEERTLDEKGMLNFHHWIRASIAANKPMDVFARELIAATGSTYQNPAANFYRAHRTPSERAESVAQVFLGLRLQCAQCHNHPFDRWSQADYHDWSAVFGRVNYKVLENRRRDSNDSHEFKGEQVVYLSASNPVKHPRTGTPAAPRFLGTADPMPMPEASIDAPATQHERPSAPGSGTASPAPPARELDRLASWLTDPANPFFARTQVNRIWYHLMGRGLVDPIDDFRPTNPASHPELLEALAAEFVAHRFDLRHIIRRIMQSSAYQLSSTPNDTNADDTTNYSHTILRRLSAEQLFDSQHQALRVAPRLRGYPAGMRAAQLPGAHTERRRGERISDTDLFLELFGRPQRLLSCECERSMEPTLGQVFQLMSGPVLSQALAQSDNRLAELAARPGAPRGRVEELYWAALTRPPSRRELEIAEQHLLSAEHPRQALEDITWSLLNAKEFLLRQ